MRVEFSDLDGTPYPGGTFPGGPLGNGKRVTKIDGVVMKPPP